MDTLEDVANALVGCNEKSNSSKKIEPVQTPSHREIDHLGLAHSDTMPA
jgi:hypothetical protein